MRKPWQPCVGEEADAVHGFTAASTAGRSTIQRDAERADRDEPDQHHRPERDADAPGAAALHEEQRDQDRRR